MKTTGPEGATYSIRRRWLPWRWRRRMSAHPWDTIDVGAGVGLDDLGGVALAVVGTVVVGLIAPIVLLALLTGVEFLLLLVLLPLTVLVRFVFGRHWHVEVRRRRRLLYDVDGGDWAASRPVIADLAERIRLGQLDLKQLDS